MSSSTITLIVLVVVLVGMFAFMARSRRRQAEAVAEQAESIGVGAEVMTTSGLYGSVAALNGDGSVQLTIAPGLQVRWATAALREVESLPDRYRGAAADAVATDAAEQPADGVPGGGTTAS